MALHKWASADLQSTAEWDANQVGNAGGVIDFADLDTDSDIIGGFARARLIGGDVTQSWLELDLGGARSTVTACVLVRTESIVFETTLLRLVPDVAQVEVRATAREINANADLEIRLFTGATLLATHTIPRTRFGTGDKNWMYVEISVSDAANSWSLYTHVIGASTVGTTDDTIDSSSGTNAAVDGPWTDCRVEAVETLYVRQHIVDLASGVTKWRPPGFLTQIHPDATNAQTWTIVGAVSSHLAVDDHATPAPHDGDATRIETATDNETERYTLQDIRAPIFGGIANQIRALAVRGWGKNNGVLPTADVNYRVVDSANALVFATGDVTPGAVNYELGSAFNEVDRSKATVDGYRIECISNTGAQEQISVTAVALQAFVDGSSADADTATGAEPATDITERGPDLDTATGAEPATDVTERGPDLDTATGDEPQTEQVERAEPADTADGAEPDTDQTERVEIDTATGDEPSTDITERGPDLDTAEGAEPDTELLERGPDLDTAEGVEPEPPDVDRLDSDTATGDEPATDITERAGEVDTGTGDEPATEILERGPDLDEATGAEPDTELLERGPDLDDAIGDEPDAGVLLDRAGDIDTATGDEPATDITERAEPPDTATGEDDPRGREASDDFNRADGALGSDWENHGSGTISVVSNRARVSATAGQVPHYRHIETIESVDMWVEATIVTHDAASHLAVVARDNGSSYYMWRYQGSANRWEIARIGSPSSATLASLSEARPSGAYRLRMEVQGTTIRGYVDGVLKVTATDANITSPARGGLRAFESNGGEYDDFEIGHLWGAQQELERIGIADDATGDEPQTELVDREELDSATGDEVDAGQVLERGPDIDDATGDEIALGPELAGEDTAEGHEESQVLEAVTGEPTVARLVEGELADTFEGELVEDTAEGEVLETLEGDVVAGPIEGEITDTFEGEVD